MQLYLNKMFYTTYIKMSYNDLAVNKGKGGLTKQYSICFKPSVFRHVIIFALEYSKCNLQCLLHLEVYKYDYI